MDARSPDQSHRVTHRRRGVGNDRPAPVRRLVGAPARPAPYRVVVGFHPHPGTGALAHQGPADVGDLPPGRHPRRACGHLPAPATTRWGAHCTSGGRSTGWHLDSGAAGPDAGARQPASKSWWHHDGALAVVFTGLPGGDLVLPVRLPQGAGQWPHLTHFLADPNTSGTRSTWCGWPTAKHLGAGATTRTWWCTRAAISRRAPSRAGAPRFRPVVVPGVDANVSNLAVASFPVRWTRTVGRSSRSCAPPPNSAPRLGPPARPGRGTRRWIARGATPTPASMAPRRGSTNAPSAAPGKGCPPRKSATPVGRGMPAPMEYHCAPTATTHLSKRYRRTRRDHAAEARRTSQAKQARAEQVAARIVSAHGDTITVEDCRICTWARLWGKRIALFSPGMLLTALHECSCSRRPVLLAPAPVHRDQPALPVRRASAQDARAAHP